MIVYDYTGLAKAMAIFNKYVNHEIHDTKLLSTLGGHMVAGYAENSYNQSANQYSNIDVAELERLGWRICCCGTYWAYCPKGCDRGKCSEVNVRYGDNGKWV